MLVEKIKYLFTSKVERDVSLRNNILFSAILKVIGLGTSLLIVPVTLNYLNGEVYGIWLTMSSILYWFTFFDIGLGNGMRNYLTEAISTKNYAEAKSILSTTFAMLSLMAILLGLIAFSALFIVDLNKLFNTALVSGRQLREAMLVASAFTLMMFVVKNVGLVFVVMQKYAINDLLLVSGNVLALLIIYVLTKLTEGNLLYVVFVFTMTPVLVFLVASVPIFIKYSNLRPTFKTVDYSLAKKVIGKGLGFFLIQITSCIVIFGSSNLFIARFCGPNDVTVYNIAYKYFNLLAIGYTIIISPLWNAYTDAYVKGDMAWIDKAFRKALKIWGITVGCGLLMFLVCNLFYRLWIGTAIHVPLSVSASVLLFICSFNLNNSVTYLLNGLNKIRIQIYTSVAFTAMFLVVMFALGHNLGIESILICMAVCYLCMSLIHLYQCRLLISRKAKGIWNK